MSQDEQALIRQAQQGNTAAFEALVTMHANLVYNLAFRTLNNPQEAEDVAQEAFVRAWQGLPQFQAKAQFSTWLYRIVTNLCYNRLPRLKTELMALDTETAVTLPDTHPAIETGLLSEETKAALHNAIENLPESYRLLITLRHLQEMSYAEIAAVTELPLGTVKTGIFRARRLLREQLEEIEKSYER
ncbi:MAG: sigma-70 family RNA polymerase sigma factor [Anaerolineae bacterium]|nr:sigma-70 family RNA polymerase sigma factor [Anaerolineae bacterium]